MFKDTTEGATHSYNDGCGEPAHNDVTSDKIEATVKQFQEYAYQLKRTNCELVLDHDIYWCGDSYACSKCGKVFIWAGIANEAITTFADEVRKEQEQRHKEELEEIVKMADKLESDCNKDGDKGIEQWRNFKGFRNEIRDRFINKKLKTYEKTKSPTNS